VSAAHADAGGAAPVVSWPVLRQYADQDLVVMLGPASEPVRALSGGRPDIAEPLLVPWRELAGERLRLRTVSRRCFGRAGQVGLTIRGCGVTHFGKSRPGQARRVRKPCLLRSGRRPEGNAPLSLRFGADTRSWVTV
jgi:hypothetical protein